MLLMGHDRPYLAARREDLGYRKVRDLYAYLCNHGDKLSPRITDMLARRLSGRLRRRPLDMRAYAADICILIDILKEAWHEHWGFVPFTESEAEEIGRAQV